MKYLYYEKYEHIGIVKFSRKEVLNALNRNLLEEFNIFLDLLAKGQQIRALVITGDGDKSFASGADINELQTMGQLEMLRYLELGSKVADTLQNATFVTIAAVNGYALGGGFEMALACDFIYASEKASFGFPEVHFGIIPGFGGTQRLTETVGPRIAKEMILSGKTISAKEALDLHVVNKICKSENLLKDACEMGASIIKNPINAILKAKKAVNIAAESKPENLLAERNMSAICFATGEREDLMQKFISQKNHHGA